MIACLFITVSAWIQWMLTIWFRSQMRARHKTKPQLLPDDHQHSTWILMSVRGADPTLSAAVKSLLNQDFREYRVCFVVDNEDDPAADVIRDVISQKDAKRVVIRHLENPLQHCTLKCSAIAEGVEYIFEADPNVAYVVMVDADSRPPANMMATLTGALHADPKTGLASGNQWFEPDAPSSAGAIVRSMWYAGGLFFSMLFNNPWAGAYAMRASDIRKTGLIEVWRESAVDDGPLKRLTAEHGLACVSLPSMIMVNRESCTLSYTTRWMTRILTWSRIHEPTFWLTAFQMCFATSLIVAIFGTLFWSIYSGNSTLAIWTAVSIVASGIMSVLAWTTVRRSVLDNSESASDLKAVSLPRSFAALLLVAVAQGVYAIACIKAIFAPSVCWRGINYSVSRKGVSLQKYVPFSGPSVSDNSI